MKRPKIIYLVLAITFGLLIIAKPTATEAQSCNFSCDNFTCYESCTPSACECKPGGSSQGVLYPDPSNADFCITYDDCFGGGNNWGGGGCIHQQPLCSCNPGNPVCNGPGSGGTCNNNGVCESGDGETSSSCSNDCPPPPTFTPCTDLGPGTNQMQGCLFDDRGGVQLIYDHGNAPRGALINNTDNANNVINNNWGINGGPGGLTYSYSIRWLGSFNFAGGTYNFQSGSNDGHKLYLCDSAGANCSQLTMAALWSPAHIYGGMNNVSSFVSPGSHVIKLEYYNQSGDNGAEVYLNWSKTAGLPDLTSAAPTPSTATVGSALTFSSVIANSGSASTGSSFSNFFQVTASNGGSITDLAPSTMSTLSAGGSGTATSPSYTFSSVGTYLVRACADKSSAASSGSITESDENNNCSSWTTVTVSSAPVAPTPPACGIAAQAGRTIINFDSSRSLWNSDLFTDSKPVNLAAGNYRVTLQSWDGYIGRDGMTQPDETWRIKFMNAGSNQVALSGKTTDLQDFVTEAQRTDVVNNTLSLPSSVAFVQGQHGPYPDTSSPNSVHPICAAFDLLSTSCTPQAFVSGNVSPSSIAPSGSYTMTCNYGVISGYITPVAGSPSSCSFTGWTGTNANFNCTAGNTPGTFSNSCRISDGGAPTDHYCLSTDPINSLTITPSSINGACGSADGRVYANGSSSFAPYTQCNAGNPSSTSFPPAGSSVTWTCSGQNGGAQSANCSASQALPPPPPPPPTYLISLTKGGYGTVASNPSGINCGNSCTYQSASFDSGANVTLTPTAGSNRVFVGWGGDCAGAGKGVCTLNMNSNKTVIAVFTIDPQYNEF